MAKQNPFTISGYDGPEFFCDREEETKRLKSAIKNKRNITLISIRRMGKTGLIQHVIHDLKQKRQKCFYMDILPTSNLLDFTQVFSKTVLNQLDSTPEKIIKKVLGFFSNVRPVINVDPLSGTPSVTFDLNTTKEAEHTLELLFEYIRKKEKKVVIAIDEFQQIAQYPEQKTEALLRSLIQQTSNAQFIFSGSHQHLITEMFSAHGRPFYQSTEIMYLEPINEVAYTHFIMNHFSKARMSVREDDVHFVLKWANYHTWYVQFVFNRLFSLPEKKINSALINNLLLKILKEHEAVFYNYRNLLTAYQWKLLKAIAKEDGVMMPTSKDFINAHNLGAPSSVKTALTALLDRQLLYRSDNQYRVYDVFLSRWLERN